jgi:hypothetical protein
MYNNSIHVSTSFTLFKFLYSIDLELGFNIKNDILEGGARAAKKRIKLLRKKHEKFVVTSDQPPNHIRNNSGA